MARISKGKFRNLRDHFASQKYFTVTKKNIESMKIMLGDDIRIGDKYVMREAPMSDEMIAALNSGASRLHWGQSIPVSESSVLKPFVDRLREKAKTRGTVSATVELLSRKSRWAE